MLVNPVSRILVADDCAVIRQSVLLALDDFNCAADFACNGQEAIQLIRQYKYDLVLMDVEMPVLDGLQATRKIRQMEDPARLVPIIAVTTCALAAVCQRAGMNDYFVKPADYKMILSQWLPQCLSFEHHGIG
ncbi:MAG: response regulator [Candidatus Obscuribacterales bacterium]|nr:response regulator [Candidatus Obscuribacterales bacterium]